MWTVYAAKKIGHAVKGHERYHGAYQPSPVHTWAKAKYEELLAELEEKAEARKSEDKND